MGNEEFCKASRKYSKYILAVAGSFFLLFVNSFAEEECILDYTAIIDYNDEFIEQQDYGWGITTPNYVWEYINSSDDLPEDLIDIVPYAEGIWIVNGSAETDELSLVLVPRFGNYSKPPDNFNSEFNFSLTYYSTLTAYLEFFENGAPVETVTIDPSELYWTTFSFQAKSPFTFPLSSVSEY